MRTEKTEGGVSVLGVVQIVFIILKLVGVIGWSWWLVLLPLEISVLLLVVCVATTIVVLYMNNRKEFEDE